MRRRAWSFAIQPQAVVINLGTNDISNGKGDPGTPFRDAYRGFVEMVRAKYPNALIICMIGPLLSAAPISRRSRATSARSSRRATPPATPRSNTSATSSPQTSDKAACQYHPNPAENQIMGNQLAAELRARLGW